MAQPWAEAGYLCYCVDLLHEPGEHRDGNIIRVGADMRDWLPPRGDIAFAAFFPPCTDVAVSGARWFKDKGLGSLINSLALFDVAVKLAEWSGAPYMIENPVSVVSTYWRKPDYTFDPWNYGDLWSKKTCLWTGGGFRMPEYVFTEPPADTDFLRIRDLGSRGQAERSVTPRGFAEHVFLANRRP